jgi:hypothetical protein
MPSYDFSSNNFKEFCDTNDLDQEQARTIVFDEIKRLFLEISKLKLRRRQDEKQQI